MLILFIHLSDIFKSRNKCILIWQPLIPQNEFYKSRIGKSLNSSLEYTEAKRQFKAKLTAAFFSTGFWKVIQVNKLTFFVKSVANPGKLEFARQKFGKDKGFRVTKRYQFRCREPFIFIQFKAWLKNNLGRARKILHDLVWMFRFV